VKKSVILILFFFCCASFAFADFKNGQLYIFSKTGKTYNVFIDDQSVGKTPLKLQGVLAGMHYIRIVDMESLKPVIDKTINVKEEQNTILVEEEMQAQNRILETPTNGAPNLENKSVSDKLIEYNSESRNPWIAVGIAWFLPSLGHAYAGDWGRGLLFLAAEITSLVVMTTGISSDPAGHTAYTSNYTIGLCGFLISRIWEYFDAYSTAEVNNSKLKKRLDISSVKGFWSISLEQSNLLNNSLVL